MEYIFYCILVLSALYSTWIWDIRNKNQAKIIGLIIGQIYTLCVKVAFLIFQIKELDYFAPMMMIVVMIQFFFDVKHMNLIYRKYKTHDINETGFLDFVFDALKVLNIIILTVYAYIAIGNVYVNYGEVYYEIQTSNNFVVFKDFFVIGLTNSIRSLNGVKINAYTLFAFSYQFCCIVTIATNIIPNVLKSIYRNSRTNEDK